MVNYFSEQLTEEKISSTMKTSKMQSPKHGKLDLQCAHYIYMEITSTLNEFVAVKKATCM